MKYEIERITADVWQVFEQGHDPKKPLKAVTFAFDTETLTYLDGKTLNEKALARRVAKMTPAQRRERLSVKVWAWQAYDEANGFYMSNDFNTFLAYLCRCGYAFGWCYNATFDFAQIDYKLLGDGAGVWQPHKHEEKGSGKGYNKGQPYTYESVHNDMGARYAYKLWFPYKNKDGHTYTHAVEFRDFMKFVSGGLGKLLKDLNVKDANGEPIRKLTMEYQAVNPDALTDEEIAYCENDVKGLYFAVKQFNETIEKQSAGECHIFGDHTNLMTAGGFAKRELLRAMYPHKKDKKRRLEAYQKEHPITQAQDEYIRQGHLYRGGISFVNPRFKGKLITADQFGRPMNRYDVNSEYPYSMASIRDLVGVPFKKTYAEYLEMPEDQKEKYEVVYILKSAYGRVKAGYLGLWYDPFKKSYVETIDETGTHLIFKREFDELLNWYDEIEIDIDDVLLCRRGGYAYAPFINANYGAKAQATNKTERAIYKLLLNSSYGKLAERIERQTGHYELSAETGAVHFVKDEIEVDLKASMSVLVGALVTAFARCYIMRKIRETCGERPAETFVYIDTDSIHAFADYPNPDDKKLGELKLEAVCNAIKYIAPKTYIDIIAYDKGGRVNWLDFEMHSKGISVKAVYDDLKKKQKGKSRGLPTLSLLDRKFSYGATYSVLCAMNVKGGKLLLPTIKYLARPELGDDVIYTNMDGNGYLIER